MPSRVERIVIWAGITQRCDENMTKSHFVGKDLEVGVKCENEKNEKCLFTKVLSFAHLFIVRSG